MMFSTVLCANHQSVHNFTPHRPTDNDLALPAQTTHLLELVNLSNGHRPRGFEVASLGRPTHSRCSRRSSDECVALLTLVASWETNRACNGKGLLAFHNTEAVLCVMGACF